MTRAKEGCRKGHPVLSVEIFTGVLSFFDGTGSQNTAHKKPSLVHEKHTSTYDPGMVRISTAPPVISYGVS